MKFAHQETRDSRLSYGGNPEYLSHLGLVRYRAVSDRRTYGQNYVRYSTRLALRAVARKNSSNEYTVNMFLPEKVRRHLQQPTIYTE